MPKLRNKIALLYRYLIIATKRLTDKQLMILLAIVVGLAAGFATFVFERALMFFRFVLTSWFDIDTASVFYQFTKHQPSSSTRQYSTLPAQSAHIDQRRYASSDFSGSYSTMACSSESISTLKYSLS